MLLTSIIKGTPLWVWILLIVLIKRGINALSDREITLQRLFLLPVIFLIWAIYSVATQTRSPDSALSMMIVGLITGALIGWRLCRSQPALKNKPDSHLVIAPGTPLILILIIINFSSQFSLETSIALHPQYRQIWQFNLLFGFIHGLTDGVFWGRTAQLMIPWYRNRQQ